MSYEEYKELCLLLVPQEQQAKWLQTHLIVPDFENEGEWIILEIQENNGLDKFTKWL